MNYKEAAEHKEMLVKIDELYEKLAGHDNKIKDLAKKITEKAKPAARKKTAPKAATKRTPINDNDE